MARGSLRRWLEVGVRVGRLGPGSGIIRPITHQGFSLQNFGLVHHVQNTCHVYVELTLLFTLYFFKLTFLILLHPK